MALSLLAPMAPAQLFVVDPAGGGTHTDLQTAINAAPAGAVIRVVGGTWGPLVITRTVTIVGENTPRIRSTFSGMIGVQPPAIRLQGTGSETAVLAGLDVSGDASGLWNEAGPGLHSTGFHRIAILDSKVEGHEWSFVTGSAQGASAIVVPGAVTLHLERCTVSGSMSRPDGWDDWAWDGAAGINAPGATVVVLDSTVTGGRAGNSSFMMYLPGPMACPCIGPYAGKQGRGGAGIVATTAYFAGSTVAGGAGSAMILFPPLAPSWTPYGQQPAGPALVVSAQTTFASTLAQTTPLRLGSMHTVGFAPTTQPALMLFGSPAAWHSTVIGIQFVFVDLGGPVALDFVPVNSTSWSIAVPASVMLLGFQLAEQRFDLSPAGAFFATNPVFGVVLP